MVLLLAAFEKSSIKQNNTSHCASLGTEPYTRHDIVVLSMCIIYGPMFGIDYLLMFEVFRSKLKPLEPLIGAALKIITQSTDERDIPERLMLTLW